MSVNCSAIKCIHNDKDGNCYARYIQIRGHQVKVKDDTLCHSYIPETLQDAEFAQEFDAPCHQATTSNIKCGACRCIYNASSKCKAENVKISQETANCETFQTK